MFTLDTDRRIDTRNPGAEALFGYSESEILGWSGDILFVPEDREKGDPDIEARTALETGHAENERWHLRKDGTRFYGSGSVSVVKDDGGATTGFAKIMRDLTEKKQSEEDLQRHAEELARFNAAMLGCENRVIELKKEVNELRTRLGEPPAYPLEFENGW